MILNSFDLNGPLLKFRRKHCLPALQECATQLCRADKMTLTPASLICYDSSVILSIEKAKIFFRNQKYFFKINWSVFPTS